MSYGLNVEMHKQVRSTWAILDELIIEWKKWEQMRGSGWNNPTTNCEIILLRKWNHLHCIHAQLVKFTSKAFSIFVWTFFFLFLHRSSFTLCSVPSSPSVLLTFAESFYNFLHSSIICKLRSLSSSFLAHRFVRRSLQWIARCNDV